uniref:Putative conserved secreted protein n=1 Tax=Rhipicephalus microplus TaxID=6941 RepID=A0A6M2CK69_RHIMP
MVTYIIVAIASLLVGVQAQSAPCTTITLPDFLTANSTHCYDQQPLDICTPYNENDTETVRALINCTSYDPEYKVLALALALNASVAATLSEEDHNESFAIAEFIVRWCSNGYALPSNIFNYTCEQYLAMVPVTCDAPVTLSVPDVNGLGTCAERNKIANHCMEGDNITWQTFVDLLGLVRCIYFSIVPSLPFPDD